MKIKVCDNGERISISGSGRIFLSTVEGFADVMTRSQKAAENAKNKGFEEGVAFEHEHAKERRMDFFNLYCRGQNHSSGCGRQGDAEIIAMAVRGASMKKILESRFTYNKEGHKRPYKRDKIYEALSVSRQGDLKRIESLYLEFPNVFGDIQYSEVVEWFGKRYAKNGKRGKKNEN